MVGVATCYRKLRGGGCRKLIVEHFRFKETISFLVFVLMFSRTFQSRKRLGTRFSVVVIRRFYIFDNSVEISK